MKKKRIWMAVVNQSDAVVFARSCHGRRQAESAIVEYLQKNEEFDGKNFGDACFWIGEKDLRLDLQVFEMESKDFNGIELQAGLLVEPPPKEKDLYRVIYEIDVCASNEGEAAEETWKMMHADDALDPVLTVMDHKGNQTELDLSLVLEFIKTTVGFVSQRFRKDNHGRFKCIFQEFIAGDDIQYENTKGDAIDPPDHDYQPFNMTLMSTDRIVYCIKEVLETLNIGGEQSRQFAREIELLNTLLKSLEGDTK